MTQKFQREGLGLQYSSTYRKHFHNLPHTIRGEYSIYVIFVKHGRYTHVPVFSNCRYHELVWFGLFLFLNFTFARLHVELVQQISLLARDVLNVFNR